jgi:hypothetical protein
VTGGGPTWGSTPTVSEAIGNSGLYTAIWVGTGATGGSTTVNFAPTTGKVVYVGLTLYEFAGVNTVPVTHTGVATGNSAAINYGAMTVTYAASYGLISSANGGSVTANNNGLGNFQTGPTFFGSYTSPSTYGPLSDSVAAAQGWTQGSNPWATCGVILNPQTVPAPSVNFVISPNGGLATGGTTVTIRGQYFTGAYQVVFGSTSQAFTLVNSAMVTVTSPSASAGTVDVTVTTTGGTSATSILTKFTSQTASAITSVGGLYSNEGIGYTTLPVSPSATGNVLAGTVLGSPTSFGDVLTMSGGGVTTWNITQLAGQQSTDLYVFWGIITSTGASTITFTWTPGTYVAATIYKYNCREFNTTATGGAWSLSTSGSYESTASTATFPTLSGTGVYFGWGYVESADAGGGSTTGFIYDLTQSQDFYLFNPNVSGSVTPTGTNVVEGTPTPTSAIVLSMAGILAYISTTVSGTAAGSFSFTGAAAGTVSYPATAAGTFNFAGAATGTVSYPATAAGSFTCSGAATGTPFLPATAAGTFTFTGSATGTTFLSATAAGAFDFAGSTAGTTFLPATATGTLTFAGIAVGSTQTLSATAAGAFTFAGTATGVQVLSATATGAFTLTGIATATRTHARFASRDTFSSRSDFASRDTFASRGAT